MNTTTMNAPGKWYHEPWPWLLMVGPATVIVAGLFTAYLAYNNNDGLVNDDYYKEGLSINKILDKQNFAGKHQLSGQLIADEQKVRLLMRAEENFPFAATVKLSFNHPTSSKFDQTVTLTKLAPTIYQATLPTLPNVEHWFLTLEDEAKTWRLNGVFHPAKQQASLQP